MERIFRRLRRGIVVAALGAVWIFGVAPGVSSASGWSHAVRLTTSGAPYVAVGIGAFAQPGGTFLLSGYSDFYSLPGGAGNTAGAAGGVFPAPSGPLVANLVWLPDGSSLAGTGSSVQRRAPNGTFVGSPQSVPATALGVDSAGNATAAGVVSSGSYQLVVSTRPVAASSFTQAPSPVFTSVAPMTLIGLAVDPNGAAVISWIVGTTLYQATRASGASSSFGSALTIATNANGGESFASNAAGRAVLVYYDGVGYSATIRQPGGSLGTPVDISGALTTGLLTGSAAAVAADGSAATVVESSAPSSGCGTLYGLHAYRLAAGGTTWAAAGAFGGTQGDSVAYPTLAAGPAGRIDVAWTDDTRSAVQECGTFDPYQIQAGTLGAPLTTSLTGNPPALTSSTYGNGHTAGPFAIKMALNSCGDGAMIIGISDQSNSDLHNGLFTSTSTGCPAGGGRPANSSPPIVSGTRSVGHKLSASTGAWSGTAPINYAYQWQRCKPGCANIAGATKSSHADTGTDQGAKVRVVVTASNGAGSAAASSAQVGPIAPSTGAIIAALKKILSPTGKLAKISAILKHGGYSAAFKAVGAGKLTVSWYIVPKGAHLSAAKPVRVATGKASFRTAAVVKFTIKLTANGKRLLKHAKKLKLTAKGIFTPKGGTAVAETKRFTLKR